MQILIAKLIRELIEELLGNLLQIKTCLNRICIFI